MKKLLLFLLCFLHIMFMPSLLSAETYRGTINITVGETYYVSHGYEIGYTVTGGWSRTDGTAFRITSSSSGSGGCTIVGNSVGTSTLRWMGVVAGGWNVWDEDFYWTVNVTAAPVKVTNIQLNTSSVTMKVDDEKQLTATVLPTNASNKSVTWSSDNTTVATVSTFGLVRAKSYGTAKITCKANDGSGVFAMCMVEVIDPNEPTGIDISPSSKTITVGESFYASYTLTPSNAKTTITWSSDDTSIAKVSQGGYVEGLKKGSTYINVRTANGKTDRFLVTVNEPVPVVEEIDLWQSVIVHLNETVIMKKTITPSDAVPTLTWTSSNTNIATVDKNGVVTGKALGTARITVTTDNGKTDYCDVKVVKVFTAQTVEGKTMTFQILSELDKTCQVGGGASYQTSSLLSINSNDKAVPKNTTGVVTIPFSANGYTVTAIGDMAFTNCKSITTVNIPNSVVAIGAFAFSHCDSVESIVIPASVTAIGDFAFGSCRKLSSVTSMIEEPLTIEQSVFGNETLASATLYVPAGTKSAYKKTSAWSMFNTIIELSDDAKATGDVNEDEKVNGTDLVALTNIILGKNAQKTSADVNGDGKVNGTDYVALANIILGKTAASRSLDDGVAVGSTATLQVEPLTIRAGETRELTVSLTNPDDELTLLQFDLLLPDGLYLNKVGDEPDISMGSRTSEHSHQLSTYADGQRVRCLLASPGNELVDGKEGAVVRMAVTASNDFNGGTLALGGAIGVTPGEQEVTMPVQRYIMTGETTGVYGLSQQAEDATGVYSLSGQRQKVMKRGINIVNGKKIIRK